MSFKSLELKLGRKWLKKGGKGFCVDKYRDRACIRGLYIQEERGAT